MRLAIPLVIAAAAAAAAAAPAPSGNGGGAAGAGTCPWDCGDGDGTVGILDFLALLSQWGESGTSCDGDGGGVGITDFLALLGDWGLCPNPFGCPADGGDCCEANGTPGCADTDCCRAVCEQFPLCCSSGWQSLCVDLAAAQPACGCIPCDDPARCQISNLANAFEADGAQWLAADNFVPAASGEISGVCWRGMYFDNENSDECGPGPDDFRVRYFLDDGAGLPGALLAEYSEAAETLTVTEPVLTGFQIGGIADEYEHEGSHAPLAVDAGQCLWIEITNFGPTAPCQWFWGLSSEGDARSVHDGAPPDGYDASDLRDEDYTFCLTVEIHGAPACPTN